MHNYENTAIYEQINKLNGSIQLLHLFQVSGSMTSSKSWFLFIEFFRKETKENTYLRPHNHV